ncbi:MAG: DNA-binding domain-containing protein [Pseudomonadota bacterium]|nr:DNA-binding domain-containing protein [Pseudomonadota bacterium]
MSGGDPGSAASFVHGQARFAAALLDPLAPVPQGLVGPDGVPSTTRFNVYRNNVVAGLVATLTDAYPVVHRIVGDAFFAAMARLYVATDPPASPVMLDYGRGFADFIDRFEPAKVLPYLADTARLERAWVEAYHAQEARALDVEELVVLPADVLARLCFTLHPSLRCIRSSSPVLTIWQMNVEAGAPSRVELDGEGEDVLVLRPAAEVELRVLPPGGAAFVQALGEGLRAVEAMAVALEADARFDLARNLAGLVDAKAFTGFVVPENRSCS